MTKTRIQYMGTAGYLPPTSQPSTPSELIRGWKVQAERLRMERQFGGHSKEIVADSQALARRICADDKDPPAAVPSPKPQEDLRAKALEGAPTSEYYQIGLFAEAAE